MGYIQVVSPNLNTLGSIGWCLSFVENVFNTPHVGDTATDAWYSTQFQHKDRNFPDASVPVWFKYFEKDPITGVSTNYGHVAVYVPGMGILSSPYKAENTQQWFSDVDECAQVLNCTYLGWSEDIAGIQIVKKGDAMDALDVQKGYEIGMNREPESNDVINAWVGKPYKELADSFGGSIEWQRNHAHVLDYDRLAQENTGLKVQLAKATQPQPDPSVTVTQSGLWAAFKKFLGL